MIGSTLLHYTVDARLGEGGMGTVYRARDTVLDPTVAIRVLAGGDEDATRRLLHEAGAASAFSHPQQQHHPRRGTAPGCCCPEGSRTWTIPPETNPVHFAPRVRQPVLMVNGREDFDLPYHTAQIRCSRPWGPPRRTNACGVERRAHSTAAAGGVQGDSRLARSLPRAGRAVGGKVRRIVK